MSTTSTSTNKPNTCVKPNYTSIKKHPILILKSGTEYHVKYKPRDLTYLQYMDPRVADTIRESLR